MTHYDEHTLTLYVLGHESANAEREAITAHLAECRGCSEIAATLRLLHAEVDRELEAAPAEEADEPGELMRVPGERTLRLDHRPGDIVQAGAPIGSRVMRYAYRHPVTSGAGVLILGVILFFSVGSLVRMIGTHPVGRPSLVRYTAPGTEFEVCDNEARRLWAAPVRDGRSAQASEGELNARMTRIADLGGTGELDVISSASYTDAEKPVTNTLRVFNESGTLTRTIQLGRNVSFRGDEYPLYFQLGPLVVVSDGPNRPAEIIAMACNYRSPCGIYRISAKGEILGEYWHYGWVRGIAAASLAGIDHQVVILCGANEVADKADSAFPCIIVLDPHKISGVAEGTASRGFSFPPSGAELFYIKAELPRIAVDPDSSFGKESFSKSPLFGQDGSLIFDCSYRTLDHRPIVSFSFDSRMSIRAAFLTDNSRELMRLRYLPDHSAQALDRFLGEAVAGVSYWNGRAWSRTPEMVDASLVAALPSTM